MLSRWIKIRVIKEELVKLLSTLMQKAFSKAHFGELTKQLDVSIHAIERVDQERVLSVQENLQVKSIVDSQAAR